MKRPNDVVRVPVAAVVLAQLIILFVGCNSGGDKSPTTPAMPDLVLSDAWVDWTGQRFVEDPASWWFEAHLKDGSGGPAPGHTVWVEFDRPMGEAPRDQGRFQLYDDGTHGDQVPGDGIYCYDDFEWKYSPGCPNCSEGEYWYEFWGQHRTDGHHSNHIRLNITVYD